MDAMTTQAEQVQEAHRLYDTYAKHLEQEHEGEYVAIFPDGRMIVDATLVYAAQRALAAFGPGSIVFKIGEWIVVRLRSTSRSSASDFRTSSSPSSSIPGHFPQCAD